MYAAFNSISHKRKACLQPFETLTYNGQIRRLRRLVDVVLPYYNIHDAKITLLQYEDNAVYRIATHSGKQFVLRISATEEHTAAEQLSEMQWLIALRHKVGLLVPEPVQTIDGEFLVTVEAVAVPEPRHCVLLHWVPGKPPAKGLGPDTAKNIGIFIARLHQYAEHFVPPARFIRPSMGWEQLFGASSILGTESCAVSLALTEKELLTEVGNRVREELRAIETVVPQQGLIHADLHRDNILISDGKVGVIDFDDCVWGHYLLDIASLLESIQRRVASNQHDYLIMREAYFAGYTQICSLSLKIDAYLQTFKVLRDMGVVNFILNSKNARVQEWGAARLAMLMEQMRAYLEGKPSLI
ncbi:MAG TPA: phosphotransferase [Ktedonobacteraceae bacterium]|nr:phosphotransferase [Ktedonobacteraceae bacterium]